MENIFYDIKEKHSVIDGKVKNIESFLIEIDTETSIVLELEYNTNYTIKHLSKILDYYGLNKQKLRKDEMIQIIVFFEEDPNNHHIVERRRRLWNNIKELQEDKYFSKFILF